MEQINKYNNNSNSNINVNVNGNINRDSDDVGIDINECDNNKQIGCLFSSERMNVINKKIV